MVRRSWIVLGAIGLGLMTGCGSDGAAVAGVCVTDAGPSVLGSLTPAELAARLQAKNFVMIDVHVPRAGVVPGTDVSIPYDDVDAIVAYLGGDKYRKVVLTCLSGGMSARAGAELIARGFCDVAELAGGTNAWTAAGYSLAP